MFLSCALCNFLLWEGRQRPDHTQASGCPGEPPGASQAVSNRHRRAHQPLRAPGVSDSQLSKQMHTCAGTSGGRPNRTRELQRQRGSSLNLPFSFDLCPTFLWCSTSPLVCFLHLLSLGGSGLCSSTDLHLRNTALDFQRRLRAHPSSRINSAFTERVSCCPSECFSPPQGTELGGRGMHHFSCILHVFNDIFSPMFCSSL